MNLEERILNIAEAPAWYDSRERRAIALEVRKREDRIKQLEDRIQRLEKAGDALYLNSELTRWDSLQAANRKLNDQEAWRKAKEDKP